MNMVLCIYFNNAWYIHMFKGCFMILLYTRFKFGSNWPIGCGEEDEKMKSLQTDRHADGQTDR